MTTATSTKASTTYTPAASSRSDGNDQNHVANVSIGFCGLSILVCVVCALGLRAAKKVRIGRFCTSLFKQNQHSHDGRDMPAIIGSRRSSEREDGCFEDDQLGDQQQGHAVLTVVSV